MATGSRYRLNDGMAVAKVIEGEAVVINVVTGRYYSLSDAGCVAWVHLSGGSSLEETVAAIGSRYECDATAVANEVTVLIGDLLSEQLLADARDERIPDPSPDLTLPAAGDLRQRYTGVALLTFRDMEELLAFDPPLPRVPDNLWPPKE